MAAQEATSWERGKWDMSDFRADRSRKLPSRGLYRGQQSGGLRKNRFEWRRNADMIPYGHDRAFTALAAGRQDLVGGTVLGSLISL